MKNKVLAAIVFMGVISYVFIGSLVSAAAVEIVSFEASSTSINLGQSITLTWDIKNAVNATLSPLMDVPLTDTVTVTPQRTTTYVLIARSATIGYDSRRITVEVKQPFEIYFAATRNSINNGETTTLTWSTNADSVSISPDINQTSPSGGANVSPTTTTRYVIIARKNDDWQSRFVDITVNDNLFLESYLAASRQTIRQGESTTLTWSTNADRVEFIPDINQTSPSGGANVSPNKTTNYIMQAHKSGKVYSKSIQITVLPVISTTPTPVPTPIPPTPIPTPPAPPLTPNPSEVYFATPTPVVSAGSSVTLVWSVVPRFRVVSFEPAIGQVGNSGGTIIPAITQTTTFKLTVTDGKFYYVQPLTVNVQ